MHGAAAWRTARILLRTVDAVRARVAPEFCVAVKLNSADFQRGGFEAEDAMRVVEEQVAMVGMATAMAIDPALPRHWRGGGERAVEPIQVPWKNKAFASVASMSVVKRQLRLLSQGRATRPGVSPLLALIANQVKTHLQTGRYRKWVARG